MHRAAAVALVLALTGCAEEIEAAAPAGAVRTLAPIDDRASFTPAGDGFLYAHVEGRVLEVRDGTGVVHRFEAPEGAIPEARLAASAERAGLVVITEDDGSSLRAAQEFTGPPAGPLEPVGPLRERTDGDYFPAFHQIEGARVVTDEFRGDLGGVRWTVREPGAEARLAKLPREAVGAVFAGDLAAYAVPVGPDDDYDAPDRLIVRDWRSGDVKLDRRIRGGVEALDLRPDGRIVLNEDGGGLLEVHDGRVKRLTRTGVQPQWAGEHIVFLRQGEREGDEHLMVVEPGGRVRRFGVPTAQVHHFVADDTRVLWSAHGCLLQAPVTAPAAREPGPGPCPRTEVFMDDDMQPALTRSRRVPFILRCIAAAPAGCRGTVRLRDEEGAAASSPVRFRIPVGRRRRIVARVTPRAYRAALREGREGIGGSFFVVEATAVDPAGRRSVLSDGYGVLVP